MVLLPTYLQNEARKANQTAIVAEKKRMEPLQESRGISKQKWLEERNRKIGRLLDANGLDMTKAYMLDTQDAAEAKYKKWEKDPAPFGWDGELLSVLILTSYRSAYTCWSFFLVLFASSCTCMLMLQKSLQIYFVFFYCITYIRIISNIKSNSRFDELSTFGLGVHLHPL